MAIVKKLQKFGRLPTSLIINGGDFLGVSLAESLLEQSSKVIVIDEFTAENKERIKHLMESDLFTYGDFTLLENLSNASTRIDYIFYLNYDLAYHEESIDTQYFMKETKLLDKTLKLGVKKKVKFLFASSMEIDRYATSLAQHGELNFGRNYEEISYTTMELQRYAENLVMEYHKKAGLNSRIIRLGEVYGEGMEVDRRTELVRLLKSAVKEKKLVIYGEGLQTRYYLHVLDATYGLIKSQFGNNTNGEIFSLANPEETSELSLAYKILEFNPNADEVQFEETDRRIYPSRVSIPAENLSVIGWTPHIDFEKGIFKTLSYFYKELKATWKNPPQKEDYPEDDVDIGLSGAEQEASEEPMQKEEETIVIDPKYEEESNMLVDKTKRIVEVAEKEEGSDGVVRVLPVQEDRNVRKDLLNKMIVIPKTVKDPNVLKWVLFLAVFIPVFILVLFPVLRVAIFTISGTATGLVGLRQVQMLKLEDASKTLALSHNFYARGSESLNYFKAPSQWVKLEETYSQSTYIMSMLEHFAAAGERASKGLAPWVKYFDEFEPLVDPNNPDITSSSTKLSYEETINAMADSSGDLVVAAAELREAKNAYQSINKEALPGFVEGYLNKLGDKLEEVSGNVDRAVAMVDYIPDLLGKDERKNYLVLFQNPYEIRSTGGWIGGYAIVGVEGGQLRKLEVDDIYNADGKLQVENRQIDPPKDMKDALEINQWTLSLSNWNPDFPATARDAEFLTRDILEIPEIDGVITIDIYLMRDLLTLIGEVNAGGDEGVVSADNFFNVVLTLREGFEPGDQSKSSFLGRVGSELLNTMLKLSRDKWPEVGDILIKNLDTKHILLAFDNPSASRAVIENGWGGSLLKNSQCDFYLYPVDYNWSGNKVNAFIERSSDSTVTIDEWSPSVKSGKLNVLTVINYVNTSSDTTFEAGDYENYLRIYLPDNSEIATFDGFRPGSVKIYKESGKTVVGGWVDVQASSGKQIEIEYSIDWVETDNNKALHPDLAVCVQKQPGVEGEQVFISIDVPTSLNVTDPGRFGHDGAGLNVNTTLEKDFVETVKF